MSDPGSGAVYAVDAATGEERWHVSMDNAVTAEIAIADSIIYVISDTNHTQGDVVTMHQTLRALDVVTGQEVWTFTMPGVASALMTAPTVYDGIVYVSRSYSADAGTGAIYALDAKTGQQIWTQTTSDGLWNPEPAVAHNGMIYIAASTPRYPRNQGIEAPLYVFDAKTGKEKWTFRHGGFSRPFGDHEPGISPRYKTRCLNKSNFARPYICLLINFRRFTWPSVWPLLHINEQPFRTAARSFFTLTAKW